MFGIFMESVVIFKLYTGLKLLLGLAAFAWIYLLLTERDKKIRILLVYAPIITILLFLFPVSRKIFVAAGLDGLLERYGYVREGNHYRVERESTETITFFCHFGITCVLLSHLWKVSPFLLWQTLALAPTSVTEVVTEERQQGIAIFRALRMGDISHLYAGKEAPSFSARFCETYGNEGQRH